MSDNRVFLGGTVQPQPRFGFSPIGVPAPKSYTPYLPQPVITPAPVNVQIAPNKIVEENRKKLKTLLSISIGTVAILGVSGYFALRNLSRILSHNLHFFFENQKLMNAILTQLNTALPDITSNLSSTSKNLAQISDQWQALDIPHINSVLQKTTETLDMIQGLPSQYGSVIRMMVGRPLKNGQNGEETVGFFKRLGRLLKGNDVNTP